MKEQFAPELEAFIAEMVAEGHVANRTEVLQTALWMLKEQFDVYKQKRDDLRKLIAVGVSQLDRGESVDGELVFRRLREKIAKAAGEIP